MAGQQKKSFFLSKSGRTTLNYAYSFGAAIVILGALFKINHWPFAKEMLIVGMGMEVLIFIVSAFEPQFEHHDEYEWERVYPELADDSLAPKAVKSGSAVKQLDDALSKAKIEQEMLNRLGENLGKLSTNINSMNSVADAAGATHEYSTSAKAAAKGLTELQSAFAASAESVKQLAGASVSTKEYHEQVQTISKNLSQLNTMYELELQDTNNHIKSMNKFYGNLVDAMKSLEEAKEDSAKFKANMGELSKNLTSLNSIYGSMLSAMRSTNM